MELANWKFLMNTVLQIPSNSRESYIIHYTSNSEKTWTVKCFKKIMTVYIPFVYHGIEGNETSVNSNAIDITTFHFYIYIGMMTKH